MRDTTSLWLLPETALCAITGCVACCYKILVEAPNVMDGEPLRPPCHRNVRPETCPRHRAAKGEASDEPERTGLYSTDQRILVVGDGDFTFSLALAKSLGEDAKLTCTSFQSRDEVTSIYADGTKTLSALEEFSDVKVEHGVDATALAATLSKETAATRFNRVVFNFPCVPDDVGQDGQTEQLEANRNLVRGFLKSAESLLEPDGEVHLVHKTRPPFGWWGIESLGDTCEKIKFIRSVVFDRSVYPGYIPRKVGENKSFPVFDAVTYCFGTPTPEPEVNEAKEPQEEEPIPAEPAAKGKKSKRARVKKSKPEQEEPKEEEDEKDDENSLMSPESIEALDLVKLSRRRLVQVVSILQLAATGALKLPNPNKKRNRSDFVQVPKRDGKKARKRTAKRRGGKK